MKIFYYCFLLAFLWNCSNKPTVEEEINSDAEITDTLTESQLNDTLAISDSLTVTPENFPLEWLMLTEDEGEYIIYNPCDAGNFRIVFHESRKLLVIEYGQDAADFVVTDFKVNDKSNNETAYFNLTLIQKNNEENSPIFNVQIKYNLKNSFSEWTGLPFRNDDVLLMINASKKNQVKTIDQPCKECWDEC